MNNSTTLQAFEHWLKTTGTAEQIALFDQNVVEGILIVAQDQPIAPSHIDDSATLAAESGAPEAFVQRLKQVGDLLLRFQDAPESRADAPAPKKPKAKASASPPPKESTPVPGNHRVLESPPSAQKTSLGSLGLLKKKRSALIAGAGATLCVALFAGWFVTRKPAPASIPAPMPVEPTPVAATGPQPIRRIHALDLSVRFPAGWQHGKEEGPAGSAVLYSGDDEPTADQRAFVAVIDHAWAGDAGDDALLSWTQAAEIGASGPFASDAGSYRSAGCGVSMLGSFRTGHCAGQVPSERGPLALDTYLRMGTRRAALAVFVRHGAQEGADAGVSYDTIVSSFKP